MKEIRERGHHAHMSSFTPEDIKGRLLRTPQRKASGLRGGNIKDPNAPKRPPSAYFMFLERIRLDPILVKDVFGDETGMVERSVLAAEKWRSMTDEERKVRISLNPPMTSQLMYLGTALPCPGRARKARV
jgi:hypothetical protein